MRLSVLLVTTAAFVNVVKSQQFSCSYDHPDTLESVKGIPQYVGKGEKGDTGLPGRRGPVGVGEKGDKGKKGETPQEIDLEEIWNVVTTANEHINELKQKNAEFEENFSKLEAENADLSSKLNTATAHLDSLTENVTDVTEAVEKLHPRDCQELLTSGSTLSGVYDIRNPSGVGTIKVHCEQIIDGGGWTVFQQRKDGSVSFYQDWQQYKAGFGDVSTEYWLGLENLHHLTSGRRMKLRVELKDFDDDEAYAEYSSFSIAPSSDNYRLTVSGYSGTAGNSLTSNHNGMQFSTHDADHDTGGSNCATLYGGGGGWWFGSCFHSLLNGPYHTSARAGWDGVVWYAWRKWKSLKEAKMMIRA